jgi:protein-S-isoprenylcysteine O-methyltransferase Ste14
MARSYNEAVAAIAWTGAALFFWSLGNFYWRYFVTFGSPAPDAPPAATAAAINVALFTVFALHHSLLARSGAKAWVTRTFPPKLERSIYVIVASILFLITCNYWQPIPAVVWDVPGTLGRAMFAVPIAGIILSTWSAVMLDSADLAGVNQFMRKPASSPAPPDPDVRSDGPYRLVRHPIYFAWLLVVWGMPHMNGTRLSFAIISTLYLAVAIPFEERSLVGHFGEKYTRYQKQVRWRMLPFVY